MSTVVLIHGIWMTGIDMSLLRYRLKRKGYSAVQFSYPTVRCDLSQNAQRLSAFVSKIDDDVVHFVAHSLGGLLIRQFFHDFPEQRSGRIVTLGTPHQGSVVARRLGTDVWGKAILGKSLKRGLSGEVPGWAHENEIGVLAGSASMGVGMVVTRLPKPHDGTVSVKESVLEGAADYKVLPVTHMAMMMSPQVVEEVHHFLSKGSFIAK